MFYYHLDLFQIIGAYKRGAGMDPDRILTLISRLPDTSMLYAVILGGEDWKSYLDWGQDRQIGAGIYDLITILARGTINWQKGKEPKFPAWERPGQELAKKKETEELSDLEQLTRVAGIFGGMSGFGKI